MIEGGDMFMEPETFYPANQVATMTRSSARRGLLLGFWVGVVFMALTDVADLHVCIGQCDGQGVTLFGAPK